MALVLSIWWTLRGEGPGLKPLLASRAVRSVGGGLANGNLIQSTNRRVAYVIGPSDVRQHLPSVSTGNRLSALVPR